MKTLSITSVLILGVTIAGIAAEADPPAVLLSQSNGETVDLMIRLHRWEAGLEGYNLSRRVVAADGKQGEWLVLNEVEPLTPYAAKDKDLSNVEIDPDELTKLEEFNREQVGKVLRAASKEDGWAEMLKPDPDNRMMRMLNYQVRQDYRLAKLIGLGLTDRQVPLLKEGEKLEYALFPIYKGEEGKPVHSVTVSPKESAQWPTDFHFNVERREFGKDSMLKFSWQPEQIAEHQVTGFMTFYRPKGTDVEYKPTSKYVHPTPATGEYSAFHKWETEDAEYDYVLACVNAFGTHGPFIPEGTSTDKFTVEAGPTIAPGVKLVSHYSKTLTIAQLKETDSKLRSSSMKKKTNGIGTIKTEFVIHMREGKEFLVVSYDADLEKVELKCLVKVLNQRTPLIPSDKMQTKVMKGKLYKFAELTLGDDEQFAVVTEVWTK